MPSTSHTKEEQPILIVLASIGGVILFVLCVAVFAVAMLWQNFKTRIDRIQNEKAEREQAAAERNAEREKATADALTQAAEEARVRNLQAAAAFRAQQLAAFRAQELAAEEQLALQRSNRAGAYEFIGSPTVMTPLAEIQIALIQLEAAFSRVNGKKEKDGRMQEDREWREAVRTTLRVIGAPAPVAVIPNPCFTTGLATATASTVHTGVVYSADDGWASVAMATSTSGAAAYGASAPAPSAPPAPREPRMSEMDNNNVFVANAAAKPHRMSMEMTPIGAPVVVVVSAAPVSAAPSQPPVVTTTPTSYSPVTVAELRTQLLKLEEAIRVPTKVHEWSMHHGFLRGKWLSFLKTDERRGNEAYACARLASSLLLLDKALETRRPCAKAKDLVWRDLLSNQGDVRLRLQLLLLLLLLLLLRTFTVTRFSRLLPTARLRLGGEECVAQSTREHWW